jgi:glycosyltransferase involved in cell wall biosynthesis
MPSSAGRPRVAIVYPYVPHYREAIFAELARSPQFAFTLFAGDNTIDQSILAIQDSTAYEMRSTPIFSWGGATFQSGLLRAVLGSRYEQFIFLGDPHFVTTWIYAVLARLRGKPVWFWTHGWLREERGLKRLVRLSFYRLASGLMLYGRRARDLGCRQGYPERRQHVIYNSLDYKKQATLRGELEHRQLLPAGAAQETIVFACVARLTPQCKFEQAIEALALLRERHGIPARLALIGDGSARAVLATLAQRLNVDVTFHGALYQEQDIGPIIWQARAVVSPGKVGLTAMHSLAYGTPVISHDDLDTQMPEVEAIVPGVTGDLFRANDAGDLARVLAAWASRPRTGAERRACIDVIEERYTPERQRQFIEAALSTTPDK